MTDRYLGWTVEELKDRFDYDECEGFVVDKETGSTVGYNSQDGLKVKVKHPVTGAVKELSVGRVAVMLLTGSFLDSRLQVSYADGNYFNLENANLVVVKKGSNAHKKKVNNVIPTEHEGIFYHMENGFYIVRRGPKQSIFRSFSLKDCVAVYKRWRNNENLNEWDDWMPVAYR